MRVGCLFQLIEKPKPVEIGVLVFQGILEGGELDLILSQGGANDVQEVAYTLSMAVSYLRALLDRGVSIDDAAKTFLIDKGYDEKYGARPLRRTIQNEIGEETEREVSNKVSRLSIPKGKSIRTALVYDGRLSPGVEADRFFDFVVPAEKLLS